MSGLTFPPGVFAGICNVSIVGMVGLCVSLLSLFLGFLRWFFEWCVSSRRSYFPGLLSRYFFLCFPMYIPVFVGICLLHRRLDNGDLGLGWRRNFSFRMFSFSSSQMSSMGVLFLVGISRAVSVDCWVSCLGCGSVVARQVFVGSFLLGLFFFLVLSSWLSLGGISFLPLFRGRAVCPFLVAFAFVVQISPWFLFLFFRRRLYRYMRLVIFLFRGLCPRHLFWEVGFLSLHVLTSLIFLLP